jgi:large subunit ribosomal protein L15
MKLHDLRPAEGSNTPRTRVGRGISAGQGKTAGRGTKGQKARAGGSIPPWFEGGQTPLHMRIPKLRGFKQRLRIHYEVVNVGDIAARIEAGAFAAAGAAPKKGEQLTINADILRAVGLVRNVARPLKILGNGEISTALFVVADAYTKSAAAKIEAAGGTANVLEVPLTQLPALGLDGEPKTRTRRTAAGRAAADLETTARARRDADALTDAPVPAKPTAAKADPTAEPTAEPVAKPARGAKAKATAVDAAPERASDEATADEATEAVAAEHADAPEAVADETATEPVSGDDSESDASAPAGDESA